MEIVVVAAIIAVSFGAAATWLLATRLPASWLEHSANEGRYAHLGVDDTAPEEADSRRAQARTEVRRVRRARARWHFQRAAQMMRTLRHRDRGHCGDRTLMEHNEKTRA
ncbi:hypothetical protein [Paraburkholderia sp. J41]|uniref:hypothetical protein n=1 Tax=Paraburkholderia sp. J41 TaxID=2805433 RepID=UPI002AC32348|nr:hypothetical protein [Paraburkholderia sp. J41]